MKMKNNLIAIVIRCLVNLVLIAVFCAVVLAYRAKHDFPSTQKTAFNAILLCLLVLMAISFWVCFNC